MSEDRSRDPDGNRHPDDVSDLFAERPGGRSGVRESTSDSDTSLSPASGDMTAAGARAGAAAAMPPPLDEEAVAKHRAAKQARIRKRQQKLRGDADDDGTGPPAQTQARSGKRGSALPALRPDIKPDTPALRAERVEAIRRDLVKRRRRKGGNMLLKLWAFVVMPTAFVAYFLWFVATDMYRSESTFRVQSAESGGAANSGLLAQFLGGAGGGNDPVAVQTYIYSRDVLRLLDADHAWIAHFQAPDLDILNRLKEDATFEEAYSHYQDKITVSYDPSEGIIEMAVVAADADTAERFSSAIIGYAERMVDDLSNRIQADAIADSSRFLEQAETELKAAQLAEAQVRKQQEIFSIETEVANAMTIITGMETELEALSARLSNLRRVTSEDDPRVERIRNQIETLETRIEQRRAAVAGNDKPNERSLADINADLARAQFDVQAAMTIFSSALQSHELARMNATRQQIYLTVIEKPSTPDEANYPNKPQLLALAFIGLLGFYIVFSLTVSLIREQASI